MPNLRDIRAAEVAPSDSGAVPYQGYDSTIAGGLNTLAYTAAQLQRESAVRETNALKIEAAKTTGSFLGEFVGEQASFLEDAVDNERARAEARALEDGVTVGKSGSEVLKGAAGLSRTETYLRETGQMNTLNQIKLLRKQQELIARRPDLGEDIVRLTNAAATDSNAILKKDEEDETARVAAERAAEEGFYDTVLKANNAFDPRATISQKRKAASAYQHYQQGKQAAADELLELEQGDKVDALVAGRDERAFQVDTRARKRAGQAIIDGSYLPNVNMGITAQAQELSQSGLPPEEAKLKWMERRQLVLADLQQQIKDPELYQQAASRVTASFDMYTGYVTGAEMTDGMKQQIAQQESEAVLRAYGVSGSRLAGFVAFSGKLGPVMAEVVGKSKKDTAFHNTINSVFVALDQAGVQIDNSQINLPGQDRNPRASLPNLGASSPYLLPNQQPKDVTDTQIAAATSNLVALVEASGSSKANLLPSERVVASQAVVSGFTDPLVARDPQNMKAMIYGLAGLQNQGAAFRDNPDAKRAQDAAYKSMSTYLDSTMKYVEDQFQKPAKELFTIRRTEGGGVVYEAKPGSGVFPTLTQRLNQDANAALKAWAHLHGQPMSNETTDAFLQ